MKTFRSKPIAESHPRASENQILRLDCATGYDRWDFVIKGVKVTLLCRLKPMEHFSKAGNLNNALHNCGIGSSFVAMFDNDQIPHSLFLQVSLRDGCCCCPRSRFK